jgi:hypothetical protein
VNTLTMPRPSLALLRSKAPHAPAAGAHRWTIRQATRTDLDRLVDLSIRLARRTEKRALAEPIVRAGIASLIESPAHGFILVAQDEEGALVGEIMVGGFEWSEWSNGVYWIVTSCAVHPAYSLEEREGVVRALHQSLVARATAEGVVGLKASVLEGNTWAARYFPELGIRPNGYAVFEQHLA